MFRRLLVAVVTSTALVGHIGGAPSLATPATRAPGAPVGDVTAPLEATRVDRVVVPSIAWSGCEGFHPQLLTPAPSLQCAKVSLPLDYDVPEGESVSVGMLRVPAKDPSARIGTLFVNPGGPGGSGVLHAAHAVRYTPTLPGWASAQLLSRFDIVGMDPRGSNTSQQVSCFDTPVERAAAERRAGLTGPPPRAGYIDDNVQGVRALAQACATRGGALLTAMSTAQVARDMDVLRRTLGDDRLTFIGSSYGTVLAQVYADIFPDRVRAIVADSAVDAAAWFGTANNHHTPRFGRVYGPEAAQRALVDALRSCDHAGAQRCPFAGPSPALERWQQVLGRVSASPLTLTEPPLQRPTTVAAHDLEGLLYGLTMTSAAPSMVAAFAHSADVASTPGADAVSATQARHHLALLASIFQMDIESPSFVDATAFYAVHCSEGQPLASAADMSPHLARADRIANSLGRTKVWLSALCASDVWSGQDEDAHTGPFTQRTATPLLFLAGDHDPATHPDQSVVAADRLHDARVVSVGGWGHGVYSTNTCTRDLTDAYLVALTLPDAKTTRCPQQGPDFPQNARRGLTVEDETRLRAIVRTRNLPNGPVAR